MSDDRPLVSYDPNPLLAWVYDRFFENIEVDEAWTRAVREADARGTVVYVLRNLSFVDFLALDYLTKRHHLPQIRFANDLGLWLLEPMGRGWLNALRPRTPESDAADIERAVATGGSAALFLKRPEAPARGPRPRQDRGRPPHSRAARPAAPRRRPDRGGASCSSRRSSSGRGARARAARTSFDAVFGSSEWPGQMRSTAQFLANYRHATLRAGEPVDVAEFLARESDGAGDDVLVRRLTYTLLRRLERERRAIVGPAQEARRPAARGDRAQPEAPEGHRRHGRRRRDASARSSPRARSACCGRWRRRST